MSDLGYLLVALLSSLMSVHEFLQIQSHVYIAFTRLER